MPDQDSADDSITIVGIDPSTDVTGVAIVRFPFVGSPELVDARDFRGVTFDRKRPDIARRRRINEIVTGLLPYIANQPVAFDFVAYETQTMRGTDATEAIMWATGRYILLSPFQDIPDVAITRRAACDVAGVGKLCGARAYPNKRNDLKSAVINWAVSEFPQLGDVVSDAVADACAVAVAAGKRWRDQEIERRGAVKPLFGKRSRGPRAAKGSESATRCPKPKRWFEEPRVTSDSGSDVVLDLGLEVGA